ncbi:MAG: hypothetical protein KIT10_14560 [Flavobacteriales bacterium]|nr:hypothetical protein [Flavobacteriales bacterium]
MKHFINFFTALFLCLFMAAAVSHITGADLGTAFVGCLAGSAMLSLVPMPQGVANAVALLQLWESAIINPFDADSRFLDGVQEKNQYVNKNIINLTEIGADPDVLVNNTVYPIPSDQRTDNNIPLALNKYETTNTTITDDELYAIPYDKPGSVVSRHRIRLNTFFLAHAAYNLCIQEDTATTPLLRTTGPDDGTGRRRLLPADLIRLQLAMDQIDAPDDEGERRLILNAQHCADLLIADLSFAQQFHNAKKGLISENYYGFRTYKYTKNPLITAAGQRKAFGSAAVSGDQKATVAFLTSRSFKASGTMKFYYRDAATNPEMRESNAGYRWHAIALPLKNTGFAAIASANI